MRDYHVHTSLCKHAVGEMEDYVVAAIERGITEMCFTEHIPLPNGEDSEHRMEAEEVEPYLDNIAILNRKYREINILAGIEADYVEGYEEYLENFLSTYHFDMVIMSVHFIKKWTSGEWVFNYEYTEETLPQQYNDYFNAMRKGINTGLFDIVAHLDLIKRPGFPVLNTNRGDVEKVLDAAKKQGMCVELNTSGVRKPIDETYPAMKILNMVVKNDIPITLASDAHRPEHVGYLFNRWFNRLFRYNNIKLARYNARKCLPQLLAQPGLQ